MFSLIKNVISDLYNSLNTDKKGLSARKLSAFAAIVVAAKISLNHATPENADSLTNSWLLFGLLCLGLVTAAQLSQIKSGQTVTESSTETKTETKETTAP